MKKVVVITVIIFLVFFSLRRTKNVLDDETYVLRINSFGRSELVVDEYFSDLFANIPFVNDETSRELTIMRYANHKIDMQAKKVNSDASFVQMFQNVGYLSDLAISLEEAVAFNEIHETWFEWRFVAIIVRYGDEEGVDDNLYVYLIRPEEIDEKNLYDKEKQKTSLFYLNDPRIWSKNSNFIIFYPRQSAPKINNSETVDV